MAHHQGHDEAAHHPDRPPDLTRRRPQHTGRSAAALAAAVLCLTATTGFGTPAGAVPAGAGAGAPPVVRDCLVVVGPAPGCRSSGTGSLTGASSLAISPGGGSVYVSAYGGDALMGFRRAAGGRLTFQGCVANGGRHGCADPASDALEGTGGIAVSPNGADVYVASALGRSVTRLGRSPSGALTFAGCTANLGAHGCTDPPKDTLAGASAVAVGPGGGDVYVTAFDGAAVSHFRRAASGTLVLADCLSDAGAFGCTAVPGNALEGADAIAVGPEGRDVYVTSLLSGSLVHLRRSGGTGALTYRSCVADDGANGCRRLPVKALLGATGLAVGDGGRRIVVASQTGVVAEFARSPATGALRLRSCVGRDGKGGCAEPARDSLAQASGVVVAGEDVYVAAQRGDAITRLRRDARGRLQTVSCVAARRAHGCTAGPVAALDGVYAVAARGHDLYAAGPLTASLSTFRLTR